MLLESYLLYSNLAVCTFNEDRYTMASALVTYTHPARESISVIGVGLLFLFVEVVAKTGI